VAFEAVVPTGLAYGDEVRIDVDDDESVTGTVVSVKPPDAKKEDDGDAKGEAKAAPVQTAAGGEARVAARRPP